LNDSASIVLSIWGIGRSGSISSIHQDGYVFPQDMGSITIASR